MATQGQLLERLDASAVPVPVRSVLSTLHAAGHQAFLAGGGVRDLLLGRAPGDWDVATSARPETVASLFPRVIPTGIAHGTVTVVIGRGEDEKVEVTTFRGEGAYLDGRRPSSVHYLHDIDEDLARRDFTCNAIAWDPENQLVRDPFGGVADIARKRVRAVGDARQRFLEDGLRPMRAVRFCATLGFGLDRATKTAIGETLHVFRLVAVERVQAELVKLLERSTSPSRGLRLMAETGLLADVAPELLEGQGVHQNRWHRWDVWEHTLRVVDHSTPDLVVRLSALLHDVAKPRCAEATSPTENSFHRHEVVGAQMAKELLERLKFSRKVVDEVAHQVRQHNWHYTPEWTDGAVRRRLAELGVDSLPAFFDLREADIRGHGVQVREGLANLAVLRSRFDAELARSSALSIQDLAIDGREIMALAGRPAGPYVGETLRALLQRVMDDPALNTRERLVEGAKELLASLPGPA